MPYPRPALSDLRAQVAADITAGLKTVDGLLRFSNLGILGTSLAGLSHQHYGFLAWIAKQATPYTASDEYLEAWAALKDVFRIPAQAARRQATWLGAPGTVLPQGASVTRSDGVEYTTTAPAVVSGAGTVAVEVVATVPGAAGNIEVGATMTLASAVTGIQSTGAVTALVAKGVDIEQDDALRTRMLAAYQAPARGGATPDYLLWALSVPGVTRAWVAPMGAGPGTVVIYTMLDVVNSASNGFPVGTDGLSPLDNRAIPATTASGDQLTVASTVFASQPVTPLVYSCAPVPAPVNFTITGLGSATPAVKAAIAQAIAQVMVDEGAPIEGSAVTLLSIESAIGAIAGAAGGVITSPVANIANVRGRLPTVGVITYG